VAVDIQRGAYRIMADELSINVIGWHKISGEGLSEVLDLCTAAYGTDYRPFISTFPEATHILGRFHGRLVSHALWVTRWLQCPGLSPWRTAYVEAVATDEKYRNRGFATQVMQRLAEEIKDYDIGALSTGSPGFYSRLDWVSWRGPLFVRKEGELVPTPNDTAMVLPLLSTPCLDLDATLSVEWREGELW
jgi:aminoglycoside 2'-N-acetyltransferase I